MKKFIVISFMVFLLIGCGYVSSTSSSSSSSTAFSAASSTNNTSSNSIISSSTASSSSKQSVTTTSSSSSSSSTNSSSKQPNSSSSSSSSSSCSSSSSSSSCSSSSSIEEYCSVTFLNFDGTILYSTNVKKGSIPYYNGVEPTKEGTYKINYTFSGWDLPLEPIFEDTTYTATFKEEELFYTIHELISFNGDYPLYYGKEVFLEDVGIVAIYSNNTFCVTSIHNPLDSFSIEVRSKESIKNIFTPTDVVSIIGTIDVINGRPFINSATVDWGYDGNEYESNNSAFIGTVKMENREYWEEKITKEESGNLYYSYMTLATIPEIVAGKDISFFITFPGEDIELSERNIFLIEARIPALSTEEAEVVTEKFQQFKKGDGIYINLQAYYDNHKMVLLPYNLLKSNNYNIPYTHKNVYSSYDDVSAFIANEYPKTYITFPDMSNTYTYNYVTKKATETINNSSMRYSQIAFYTYQDNELIDYLISLYNSINEFSYEGLDENGKHWISHPYSPNLDMHICIYKGYGKVIVEMHFLK